MNKLGEIRGNGFTLFFKRNQWGGGNTVVDINVEPGVKTIVFSHATDICLLDKMKQFPDVENIKILNPVSEIKVSNFMFPNVKYVASEAEGFESGPCLIKFKCLLNTFCKKAGTVFDLKNVEYIRENALEGCMAYLELGKKIHPTQGSTGGSRVVIGCEDTDGRIELGGLIEGIVREDVLIPESTVDINSNIRLPEGATIRIAGEKALKLFECRLGWQTGFRLHLELSGSNEDISLIQKYNDSNLKNSEVSVSENPYCKTIDGILYSKDGKVLIRCPKGRKGNVEIPEGTERIADSAFQECCNITEVKLPGTLREIENYAFWECRSLKRVDMEEGLTEIGMRAFASCKTLKEVRIPGSVRKIGDYAFDSCYDLESVILNEGLEEIGEEAFGTSEELTEISIPGTLRKIGKHAFPNILRLTLRGDRIPSGLMRAVCLEIGTTRITQEDRFKLIEGTAPSGRHFFIPGFLTRDNAEKSDNQLSIFGDTSGNLDFLFKYALFNEAKQECAIRAYVETGREELRAYLRRIAKNIVDIYLKYDMQEELIEFLKKDLTSESTLKYVIQKAEKMPEVKAYALSIVKDSKSFRL